MGSPLNGNFARHDAPTVDAATVDDFLSAAPDRPALLFFRGDLSRPEVDDIAVVLPQLVAAFPGRLRSAVVAQADEPTLMPRFGVRALPSLALVRADSTLGVIAKIQDWSVYVARIRAMLADANCQHNGATS